MQVPFVHAQFHAGERSSCSELCRLESVLIRRRDDLRTGLGASVGDDNRQTTLVRPAQQRQGAAAPPTRIARRRAGAFHCGCASERLGEHRRNQRDERAARASNAHRQGCGVESRFECDGRCEPRGSGSGSTVRRCVLAALARSQQSSRCQPRFAALAVADAINAERISTAPWGCPVVPDV